MPGDESTSLIELDANFLVAARARDSRESRRLQEWLASASRLQVSAPAWSEYLCGPILEGDIEITRRLLSAIDPFLQTDAELASELFNLTGRRSRSLLDCMIAAHAIRREALLATLNIDDFRRFEPYGLKLASPTIP